MISVGAKHGLPNHSVFDFMQHGAKHMPRGGARPGAGRKSKPSPTTTVKTNEMLELIRTHPLTREYDPLISLAVVGGAGQTALTFDSFVRIRDLAATSKSKFAKEIVAECNNMLRFPVFDKKFIVAANREVAQYIYPKLRSMELKDPKGDGVFSSLIDTLRDVLREDGDA